MQLLKLIITIGIFNLFIFQASALSPLSLDKMLTWSNSDMNTSVSDTTAKMIAPYYLPQNSTKITFDSTLLTNSLNKTSELYKVICDKTKVLSDLWLTNEKIYSIGLESEEYSWNYDIKNCSLYGTRINANYNYSETLNKTEALSIANTFITKLKNKRWVFNNLWDPIITSNKIYPIMALAKNDIGNVDSIQEDIITIDDTDVEFLEEEQATYNIIYPYLINGKKLYNVNGWIIGVSLDISKQWINSFNAPLLKFKFIKKTWEKNTIENFTTLITNPNYYFNKESVKVEKIEKAYVSFNLFRNNQSEMYISTWLNIITDYNDLYSSNKASYAISDYKIASQY